MSRRERKIQSWLENPPTDAPVDEVEAVVKYYFPQSRLPNRRGSHNIVIEDDRLKGFGDFGPLGQLQIPVKGGQKVKGVYLQKLAEAIEVITES